MSKQNNIFNKGVIFTDKEITEILSIINISPKDIPIYVYKSRVQYVIRTLLDPWLHLTLSFLSRNTGGEYLTTSSRRYINIFEFSGLIKGQKSTVGKRCMWIFTLYHEIQHSKQHDEYPLDYLRKHEKEMEEDANNFAVETMNSNKEKLSKIIGLDFEEYDFNIRINV